jgi:prephenate dehydratase
MKGSNDIFFFLEADGHIKELQIADLFRELSKNCRAVKVLGSYPKSEPLIAEE